MRVGSHVFVSGTCAVDASGRVIAPNDAYAQAQHIISVIGHALSELGASLREVVRTRIFVVDIAAHGEAVGRAHGEAFGSVQPACTMVEVTRLIDEQLLVEIEAHAMVG